MTLLVGDVKHANFTCSLSENIFSVIEKCLDNGTGICFVIDEDRHLVGRLTLDEIRRAIVDGSAFKDGRVATHLTECLTALAPDAERLANDPATERDVAMPVIDYEGRLVDVRVDRSRQFVQVAKPDLSHREFRALFDAFISSWISSKGPHIQRFEDDFAAYVGMRHGIAVSNGTAALHLALLSLGIGPGDEVIVPDLTFAATINAVLYCGATPVVVDIDPSTWTMSVEQVARAFTARTKAIIPVHLYGRPADIGSIAHFARSRGCYVIEDCAEAHGARYCGRTIGQFSDVSCFSFYGNKIVTTGEGGICLTNSETLATTILELRNQGMAPYRAYWHERVGYNYRMTNLQAAIGLAQLSRIQHTLRRNMHLERLYAERLASIPGVKFPPPLAEDYDPVVWLVCVQVPADARPRLIDAAKRAEIELRPFFNPLSSMPAYQAFARPCPNSLAIARTGLNLPTSNAVDVPIIDKIARVFRDTLC